MKIRGYVSLTSGGSYRLSEYPMNQEDEREYTFTLDIPPFHPEIKVDPSTIKEVTNNVEGTSDDALTPGDQSS